MNAGLRGVLALVLGAVGGALCWWAGDLLARLRSDSWLILGAFGLVAVACVFFFYASKQLEGALSGRATAAGILHWITMSALGLAFVAALGILIGFLGPRDLPSVMGEDFGVALFVGGVLWATGPVVGRVVYHFLRRVRGPERAARWAPPPRHEVGLSPSRALLIRCLAVSFAGLYLSIGEQVVASVGSPVTGNIANAYAPIGGWVLGTAVAWRLTTPLFPRPGHHPTRHLVHAGALTLIVFVAALSVFANRAAQSADKRLWDRSGAHNLAQAISVPLGSPANYQALAKKFSPELEFRTDEPWYPTSVSWYVSQQKPPLEKSRPNCPDGCYSLPCDDSKGACADSGTSDPTVYVNVTHGTRWPDPVQPRKLKPNWVLLQYWFFYNYDLLRMPILTQWHQADWEQVSVALSLSGDMATPVSVGYSEHCAGVVVPWSRVEIGRGTTHPLVFVAKGSHANYPRRVDAPIRQLNCSLGLKPPRYLGAGGLFFSAALHGDAVEVPVGYVFGLRDRTGTKVGPSYTLRPLAPNDAIESFAGNWGRDNNLRFLGRPRAGGAGPRSPPAQSAWKGPGQNMLCSSRWFSPSPHPVCDLRLPPVQDE